MAPARHDLRERMTSAKKARPDSEVDRARPSFTGGGDPRTTIFTLIVLARQQDLTVRYSRTTPSQYVKMLAPNPLYADVLLLLCTFCAR